MLTKKTPVKNIQFGQKKSLIKLVLGKLTALHIVEDPVEAQVAMLFFLPNYFKSPLIWPKYAKKSWGRPAKPRRAPFLQILNPLMASA